MAYIVLDRTKVVANAVAQLAADARILRDNAARVQDMLDSITNFGASPTALETGMGIPSGQGAAVYTAVHDTINANTQAMNTQLLAKIDNG